MTSDMSTSSTQGENVTTKQENIDIEDRAKTFVARNVKGIPHERFWMETAALLTDFLESERSRIESGLKARVKLLEEALAGMIVSFEDRGDEPPVITEATRSAALKVAIQDLADNPEWAWIETMPNRQ